MPVALASKLMGQVNLVRVGSSYVNDNGSLTLTSGITSRQRISGIGIARRHVEDCLPATQHVRGKVNESSDAVRPCFASLTDGDSAAAVADQHHRLRRTVDRLDDRVEVVAQPDALGRFGVAAMSRHIDGKDFVTQPTETGCHLVPAPRSVPRTVNQDEATHYEMCLLTRWRRAPQGPRQIERPAAAFREICPGAVAPSSAQAALSGGCRRGRAQDR